MVCSSIVIQLFSITSGGSDKNSVSDLEGVIQPWWLLSLLIWELFFQQLYSLRS
jgi:hypothetical protein